MLSGTHPRIFATLRKFGESTDVIGRVIASLFLESVTGFKRAIEFMLLF